ncbi:aminodeoxychorismate lyase [Neptunomonas sp.]|uniref:aminodeoxychorismate lyase n=1 Tax=Neptunomonas TaxID=75687 RepID=UPI0035192443
MTKLPLPAILINGALVDQISVNDRGLQYGDGLFETIKIRQGRPLLWDAHLARLLLGCERLGIRSDGLLKRIEQDCQSFFSPALQETCILKLIVTRGVGERGYKPSNHVNPTVIVSISPYTLNVPCQDTGVTVRICDTALGINPLLAGIKHLNRLEQVLARQEWDDPHISEGLMLDVDGNLVEGTMSNLFWAKDGVLFTPLLDRCGILGTVRQKLLSIAEQLDITVVEGRFSPDVLSSAEEVFLCNSAIDIWPVVKLAHKTWSIGPITRQFQAKLEEVYAC